ncbi:hypothetical protein SESBI_31183 [Sesbania bispinosa]|nr:hypothetical protein SESBI_31183 [Sesbania bispinosa]
MLTALKSVQPLGSSFTLFKDPDDETSDYSEKQNRRFRSLSSGNIEWSPASYSKYDQNGVADHGNYDSKENESSCDDVQFQGGQESVSSTDDLPGGDADMQRPPESRDDTQTVLMKKPLQKAKRKFVCGLSFVLLAMATPLIWINSQEEGHFLVPT